MDYTAHYQSPLGGITLASNGTALVGLWFDGQKHFAEILDNEYEKREDLPIFNETKKWLDIYFKGYAPDFTPPLLPRWEKLPPLKPPPTGKATGAWASSPAGLTVGVRPGNQAFPRQGKGVSGNFFFRKRVWEVLLTIPFGHTMTYGDIARIIANEQGVKTMSAQAVGGAVAHNSIAIIIPCHRVVGANGSLTGYAGGIDKKKYLLEMEKASMFQPFYIPKGDK